MKTRILSIDPSGTGTTGIYFKDGNQETFQTFQSKDWREHLIFLVHQVEKLNPNLVSYEHTNFINLRGKDMTSLLKLLGTLEVFPYGFPGLQQAVAIPVNQVKGLRGKLLKGKQKIEGISYQAGKGWHHHQKKISTHELDAYLVYWLWESKAKTTPKTKLASKTIEADKMKQKHKQIDIEEELPKDIDDLPWEPEDNITFCPGPELEPTCPEWGCYECVCEKETEESEEPEDIDKEIDHE